MAFYNLSNQSEGAPALTGVAGSLIAVLDWLLVTQMGWTKAFSATNTAAYKQPAGTNGFYLLVTDTGTTSARVKGFESMTSISAGTGDFPTNTQTAGGLYVGKSNAASAVARPWRFISNGKLFYFLMSHDGTVPSGWSRAVSGMCFGDFISYRPGDIYNTILIADTGSPYSSSPSYTGLIQMHTAAQTSSASHSIPRAHQQIGSAVGATKMADWGIGGGGFTGNYSAGAQAYPSPIHGGIDLARMYINEPNARRGRLPGLWLWGHNVPSVASGGAMPGDTFVGAPGTELAGKTFEFYQGNAISVNAAIVLETSDWGE